MQQPHSILAALGTNHRSCSETSSRYRGNLQVPVRGMYKADSASNRGLKPRMLTTLGGCLYFLGLGRQFLRCCRTTLELQQIAQEWRRGDHLHLQQMAHSSFKRGTHRPTSHIAETTSSVKVWSLQMIKIMQMEMLNIAVFMSQKRALVMVAMQFVKFK
jgi:hypothetical protein